VKGMVGITTKESTDPVNGRRSSFASRIQNPEPPGGLLPCGEPTEVHATGRGVCWPARWAGPGRTPPSGRAWWPRLEHGDRVGCGDQRTGSGCPTGSGSARVDPAGLFDVGARSPVTRVRYLADGERVEESVLGAAHFAAHTPYPSRSPTGYEGPAGAYLFHGTDERYWREVPDLRARCRGPILWENRGRRLHAGQPRPRTGTGRAGRCAVPQPPRRRAALTGQRNPLDALDRLPRAGLVTVLRCGGDGSLVQYGRHRLHAGVAAGPVADPTAVGTPTPGHSSRPSRDRRRRGLRPARSCRRFPRHRSVRRPGRRPNRPAPRSASGPEK